MWDRARSSPTPRESAGKPIHSKNVQLQIICVRLYKKSYRTMESWAFERWHFRFNATVLRARFDESRNVKDMRILAQMLEDGEK